MQLHLCGIDLAEVSQVEHPRFDFFFPIHYMWYRVLSMWLSCPCTANHITK